MMGWVRVIASNACPRTLVHTNSVFLSLLINAAMSSCNVQEYVSWTVLRFIQQEGEYENSQQSGSPTARYQRGQVI